MSQVKCVVLIHVIYYWCTMNDWSYFVVHHDASIDLQGDFLLNCGGLWLKFPCVFFFFKFWCMFILAFDWDKISGWKLKKFHFSLIWFSCNIMIWFINVLNCSQMYLLMNIFYDTIYFYFQYMVNRIHNNYALQVRAITPAFFMPFKFFNDWMVWLNFISS